MIRLRRFDQADQVITAAADAICVLLIARPEATIGLATGRTQEPLFAELLRRYRSGAVSFHRARFFHLDEYWRLPETSPQSMSHTLRSHFLDATDLPAERFHRINGMAADPEIETARYEAEIRRAGGIDLQLLGLGTNGHIGFNEPGSPHDSHMRLVHLTAETRRQNRGFFLPDAQVPAEALTMGIATIMDARSILVLATGASKATALRDAVEGPISDDCPASALQRHGNCALFCDADAAQQLRGG